MVFNVKNIAMDVNEATNYDFILPRKTWVRTKH